MKERIAIDPKVHLGNPCVTGTRIPVQSVLELIREGVTFEAIMRNYYPDLKPEDLRACVQFAIDVLATTNVHEINQVKIPAQSDVPKIIDDIERRLTNAAIDRRIHLTVLREESKLDDDWLYVCLTPTQSGESAADHAELMSEIEKELREEGIDNVIIIPALAD